MTKLRKPERANGRFLGLAFQPWQLLTRRAGVNLAFEHSSAKAAVLQYTQEVAKFT